MQHRVRSGGVTEDVAREVTLVAPDGQRYEISIDPADGTVLGDEPDD